MMRMTSLSMSSGVLVAQTSTPSVVRKKASVSGSKPERPSVRMKR